MLISSPEFIIATYKEWFGRLIVKNTENVTLDSMQDISIMGIFRRLFHNPHIPNTPFIIFGILLFGASYLKIKSYFQKHYQLLLLSSVLIFTVIFSSSSESPTYIIAFLGVAVWFVIQPRPYSKTTLILFIIALLITSFSPSDIIPEFFRENFIKPYALKALPCVLIWFKIIYEILAIKKEPLIA
jgi:membrane-associated HD superfamily phosphohydrolase